MRRVWLTILLLLFAGCITGNRAAAIEVTCIESSKYRHLYRLFGGDSKKLAAYLQIGDTRLPNPEFCRAALITGKIEPAKAQDVNKLLDFIVKNQGWLAALHLASEGGAIGTGYQLAFLARAFWLKTYTVSTSGTTLIYTPDFFVPPLDAPPGPAAAAADGATPDPAPEAELAQGWRAYLAEQKKLAPETVTFRACVSACGLIHAAGIERFGQVRVHRSRYSGEGALIDLSKSMSVTNEGLMRSEELQVAFYQQMDAGPDFIRTYQSTPPETTTPVDVSRYPRYVADYLNARCNADAGQLQRLERQLNASIAAMSSPLFGQWIRTDRLRAATHKVREQRSKAEQCVAAAHERERIAAFDKMCGGGCDRQKILTLVDSKVRDLAKGSR
jgi:hypothetical protein